MGENERRPEGPRASAQSTIVDPAADPGARDAEWRPPVPVGTVLGGRYRLLEALGRGGMGAVYRARDLTLDADVAVKLLDPEVASDPKRVQYFRNEVRVARKVTHPNVCRLHDLVEADGLWLITMQYVEGESLADRLRRQGALPVADVIRLLRDVATGLAAAHQVGVVHRDLKPANVLLVAGEERAIVADFGIAAETHLGEARAVDVAGTRGYMSPEQAAGRPVDARSDVYAFGVLAHRMLTGELPWTAPTRVRETDVTGPPAGAPADAPPALLGLIDECLAASAGDRPADGAALLARLTTPAARAAVGSISGSPVSLISGSPVSGSGSGLEAGSGTGTGTTGGPGSVSLISDPGSGSGAVSGSGSGAVSVSDLGSGVAVATAHAGAGSVGSLGRGRRGGLILAVVALVGVAAGLFAWRPWAGDPGAAAAPAPVDIAVEAAAAGTTAPEDSHFVDSLVRLAIAELEDGWGVRGRAIADGGAPPDAPGSARLSARLWIGSDRLLVVEARVAHGARESRTRLESTSLRQLAADLAGWAARAAMPAVQLRPSAGDLTRVCARSPEAWRLWRRARRESRMQRWSQARELSQRAAELDPAFPLAPLELSMSFTGDDRALKESLARAARLAGACSTLAREWRLAFEAMQLGGAGDPAGVEKRAAEVLATPGLESSEELYFRTRYAFGLHFGARRREALPMLEWIAEKWPTDPAVPKLLAHHFLDADDTEDSATPLRYARQALAYAPHDVAVRADLARALLAGGQVDAARAQARIIEQAEPAEKQSALAGSESDNTLVTLRLELGDRAGAERDARRLLLGPVTERNQGRVALGALDLLRGGFASGLDQLAEAHRDCKAAGIETTAATYLWRAAWQAYVAGDLDRARDLFDRFESPSWRGWAGVMVELIAARSGKVAARRAGLERARAAAVALRAGSPSRIFLEMVVAHEAGDWKRVLQIAEEMRAAGIGAALGPMYMVGDALAATGDARAAEARFLRLATHSRVWKEPVLAVRAWRRLGEVREQLGDRAGASEAYRALIERWQRAPAGQPDLALARTRLGSSEQR